LISLGVPQDTIDENLHPSRNATWLRPATGQDYTFTGVNAIPEGLGMKRPVTSSIVHTTVGGNNYSLLKLVDKDGTTWYGYSTRVKAADGSWIVAGYQFYNSLDTFKEEMERFQFVCFAGQVVESFLTLTVGAIDAGNAVEETTVPKSKLPATLEGEAPGEGNVAAPDGGPGAASINDERFSVNRYYVANPKHGLTGYSNVSPEPTNGRAVLDTSVQVKPTSPARIGVDPGTGEIVVFQRTGNVIEGGEIIGGEYHGYVVDRGDLTQAQKNALIQRGLTNSKGKTQ
jgi:hypothetical protein